MNGEMHPVALVEAQLAAQIRSDILIFTCLADRYKIRTLGSSPSSRGTEVVVELEMLSVFVPIVVVQV